MADDKTVSQHAPVAAASGGTGRYVRATDVPQAPLLVSRVLSAAGFRHGFSTRAGGVSKPPFDSLDFAILRSPELLRENQRRLAAALDVDASCLHQTKQVHGRTVVTAAGDAPRLLDVEADALVAEPGTGHAVVVRVADCVPVLIADPASGRVAAVHAGWKGIEAMILAATIEKMVAMPGAGPAAGYLAAIGPCIGACCFEVGADVAERIVHRTAAHVVVRTDPPKAYVDLRLAARVQLETLELASHHIDDVPARGPAGCTRCQPTRFYSYRRDGDASGRLVGAIVAR